MRLTETLWTLSHSYNGVLLPVVVFNGKPTIKELHEATDVVVEGTDYEDNLVLKAILNGELVTNFEGNIKDSYRLEKTNNIIRGECKC